MPFGKTKRIQAADKAFGKHMNQIKRTCENDLMRETRSIEEVYRIEMLRIQIEHTQANKFLDRLQHINHRRDAALRRSFETILERFSYSSSMDGDWTEPSSRKTDYLPGYESEPESRMIGTMSSRKRTSTSMSNKSRLKSREKVALPSNKAKANWQKIAITLPRCDSSSMTANETQPTFCTKPAEPTFFKPADRAKTYAPTNQAKKSSVGQHTRLPHTTGNTKRGAKKTGFGAMFGGKANTSNSSGLKVSQTSILQLVNQKKQSEAEVASLRQFIPPAYLVTQPMPRARDRYLYAMRNAVTLMDIKKCGYLRSS